MDFPALLSERMGRLNLRQQDIADRVGVDRSAVSKWLARTQLPRSSQWRAIAEALGVSVGTVTAALAETKREKAPTISEQLRECLARLELLERENGELRSRLTRQRPPEGR